MTGRYLLAIDAGTGSCRAVLFTETGEQVAVGQREWTHREPPGVPGGQDFDVPAGWRAVADCVRDALRAAGRTATGRTRPATGRRRGGRGDQHARGDGPVRRRRPGDLGLPERGQPGGRRGRGPDPRGRAAEKIYAEAGDWVSITAPARLRWLRRHEPGILAATGSLGMLSDWIVYRLTGQHVTEPSCGSSSGMFTLADRRWSPSITALCGLPAAVLPPSSTPAPWWARSARRRPRRPGCGRAPRWWRAAPTPSSACSAPARNATSTPWSAARSGRTRCCSPSRSIDPEARLRTLCHVTPGEWMLEGIGFYCGMSMRWFRDAFCDPRSRWPAAAGVDPYAVMEQAAAAAQPAGSIAIMSNVMNARRWVHASPSFLQFDLADPATSGRGACVRAIEEAAAYVARGHRDIITGLTGLRFGEVVFTGGAAKGRLWPQIMADVLGVPVHIPSSPRAVRSARRSAPASAPASTPTCSSRRPTCAAGRPPSNPIGPPRRPTTTATRPGGRSTGACSPSPTTACSTRSGAAAALAAQPCSPREETQPCADLDDLPDGSGSPPSVPARHEAFPIKGCGALDWGMQSRLARVFRPGPDGP